MPSSDDTVEGNNPDASKNAMRSTVDLRYPLLYKRLTACTVSFLKNLCNLVKK
jgi:hypothetical protein